MQLRFAIARTCITLRVGRQDQAATEAEHWVCLLEGIRLTSEKGALCGGVAYPAPHHRGNLNVKLTWGESGTRAGVGQRETDNNVFAVITEHAEEVTLLSTTELLNNPSCLTSSESARMKS